MTFRWTLRSAAVALSFALCWDAQAQSQAVRTYDIPSSSLDSALYRYTRLSGAQVLYEASVATGRRSRGLKGSFTVEAALASLLAGTGLAAIRTSADAFVVRAMVDPASVPRPDGHFLAAMQNSILGALCRDATTRPGGYKIGVELWISPEGVIWDAALIGSTGSRQRDDMVIAALRNTSTGATPPPEIPQPFVFTVARRLKRTNDCAR